MPTMAQELQAELEQEAGRLIRGGTAPQQAYARVESQVRGAMKFARIAGCVSALEELLAVAAHFAELERNSQTRCETHAYRVLRFPTVRNGNLSISVCLTSGGFMNAADIIRNRKGEQVGFWDGMDIDVLMKLLDWLDAAGALANIDLANLPHQDQIPADLEPYKKEHSIWACDQKQQCLAGQDGLIVVTVAELYEWLGRGPLA